MFHLMLVHFAFSSVWVAEWPPFVKCLPTQLALCPHCNLSICGFGYFPFWFWERDLSSDFSSSCSLLSHYFCNTQKECYMKKKSATMQYWLFSYVSVSAKEGSRAVGGPGPELSVVDCLDSIVTSSRIYLYALNRKWKSHVCRKTVVRLLCDGEQLSYAS